MIEIGEQAVILRPVDESDLDALFRQQSDPESVRMAAFTPDDPDDRQRFDAHMVRVMESPENTLRAITWEGELVGSIGSFVVEGQTEVTYWIDRAVWGRGIASQALALFLEDVGIWPVYARAASDNAGSLRVLEKTGFRVIDTEVLRAGTWSRDRRDDPAVGLADSRHHACRHPQKFDMTATRTDMPLSARSG